MDPCHKGQIQTCRLLPIGMFEPGPYGRAKNVLTPRAKRCQKKKKKKNIQPCLVCMSDQSSVFIFYLFFIYFLALMGPVGVQICPCHKGQVRTCRLVAIGMFESGPYGRDGNVLSPAATWGQKKQKKTKKNRTLF